MYYINFQCHFYFLYIYIYIYIYYILYIIYIYIYICIYIYMLYSLPLPYTLSLFDHHTSTGLLCWLTISLSKRPVQMFLLLPRFGLLWQKQSMLQSWPQLQDAQKSCCMCNFCQVVHWLHLKDCTVHLHGPHNKSCPHSHKPLLGSVVNAGASNNSSDSHPPASWTISQPLSFSPRRQLSTYQLHIHLYSTVFPSSACKTYYQTHPQRRQGYPVISCW